MQKHGVHLRKARFGNDVLIALEQERAIAQQGQEPGIEDADLRGMGRNQTPIGQIQAGEAIQAWIKNDKRIAAQSQVERGPELTRSVAISAGCPAMVAPGPKLRTSRL